MPKIATPLTTAQLNAAKPQAKRYRLNDGKGLMLEVAPNGSKKWMLSYRKQGKATMVALVGAAGTNDYPPVGLAEARKLADEARVLMDAGKTPAQSRQEAKAEADKAEEGTFEAVAERWYEHKKAGLAPATARKLRMVLDSYLYPGFGTVPIATLSTPQVKPALLACAEKAPFLAAKAVQYANQIVAYAIQEGLREDGRLLMLRGLLPKAKKGHYPAITSEADLPSLLQAIDTMQTYRMQCALWLCLYTAVRPAVAAMAEWREMNLGKGEWHIPASKMKMDFAHISPIPKQMAARLEKLKALYGDRGYVFPIRSGRAKHGHLSRDSLSKALRDAGYQGRQTPHGFRALFRTIARERLDVPHARLDDVLEAQLAHAKRGEVQAAYDRTQLLAERKVLVQAWADYLDSLRNT